MPPDVTIQLTVPSTLALTTLFGQLHAAGHPVRHLGGNRYQAGGHAVPVTPAAPKPLHPTIARINAARMGHPVAV